MEDEYDIEYDMEALEQTAKDFMPQENVIRRQYLFCKTLEKIEKFLENVSTFNVESPEDDEDLLDEEEFYYYGDH